MLATTTWNSVDLIAAFLDHYRRLGFDRVIVMDFDSTDGTREVLTSMEWSSFVTRVPFPGLASLDSSNLLLSVARDTYSPADWCLFCDPDELLVTPSMSCATLLPVNPDVEWVSIPRFNMTGPASYAREDAQWSHVHALTLRVEGRCTRTPEEIRQATLDPPWIFTAIMPKSLVRLGAAVRIGEGDHVAVTANSTSGAPANSVYLLHYPMRRYRSFRDKVEMARLGFAENPHLSQQHGWQVRRWVRMSDEGTLYTEYLQQFIVDEDVERLVADRTLVRDETVSRFHTQE
jgi:hypothetical protein